MRRMHIRGALVVVALLVGLCGCSGPGQEARPGTALPPAASQPPSVTALPTGEATPSRPSSPPTTPVGPTALPTITAPPPPVILSLFYVAVGDNGAAGERFGCGDSLVLVSTRVGSVGAVGQLRVSFEQLLANHTKYIGQSGLYNALWRSNLQYEGGGKQGGIVTVQLSGTLVSGGTCDDPRIIRQLQRTATVAVGADQARVLINDTPIEQLLGGRGN